MRANSAYIFLSIFFLNVFCMNAVSQEDHPEPKTLGIGSQAPAFNLLGIDDKMHSIRDYSQAKLLVVIFSCNHCPTAQAYEDRIAGISKEYANKGVSLIVISSNSMKSLNYWEQGWSDLGDSFEEMKIRARDKNFPFPYLYDGDEQKVGLAYGPVATPHSFVFDKERKLQYVGRIDASQTNGKGEDLRNAIDAVLTGTKIDKPATKVFGCSIKWAWKTEGTKKLYKEWSELPVSIEDLDTASIKELVRNHSDKLRLVNVWASWCGPCVQEFPDLVIIDRIYRSRNFEFISVNVDKITKKPDVLTFLKKHEASNKNYMFKNENIYDLIEAIDPAWQGAIPYSLLIEPGGKVIYRIQGSLDVLKVRKLIVGNKFIGD